MSRRTSVLVADDSRTARLALVAVLSRVPEIAVVGEARDGLEAVRLARELRPDLITMDVLMPGLDGLQATEAIMAAAPTRILVVSQLAFSQEDLAFRALAAGALELLAKPVVEAAGDLTRWGARIAEAVLLMREVPVVQRRLAGPGAAGPERATRGDLAAFGLVASTGGPQVLAEILAALPPDLPIPILVAQHIALGFGTGLVRWFSRVSRLQVLPASDGAQARRGCVYLAPDGCDLLLSAGGTLAVRRSTRALCPSGDLLLESMAAALGARSGGAVLSGMGEDGAEGLLAIRRVGGLTLAQEETSCVVFGMPRVAWARGAAARMAHPAQIAPAIAAWCRPSGLA